MSSKVSSLLDTLALHGCAEILLSLHSKTHIYSELEKIVGNPATTQRTLTRMIKQNLITRLVQQDQKRTVRYEITPLGKKCAEFIMEISTK